MNVRARWLIVALALFGAGYAAALPADRSVNQYVHRAWTVEQGLPHGTVRGVVQTRDGYLWLATYEGLVRFNGEEFRVFDQTTSREMLSIAIRMIARADDGTLWLGTNAGLMRYRGARFETIAIPGGADSIGGLAIDSEGAVWAGTARGKMVRVRGDRAEEVSLGLPVTPITALAASADAIWIGTSTGLNRLRRGAKTAERIEGLASNRIFTLIPDGPDAILAGTATGLERIAGNRIEPIAGLPADQITALHRDRDGNLWVGTYSHGVFRVSGNGIAAYGINDGLLNPTVRAIAEDDEGNLWIGSNGGLEQLRAGAFVSWDRKHGLEDDFVRTIFEDRDGVRWAGSADGLYRADNGTWHKDAGAPAGILAMEQSRDGTRWLGTANGLYRGSQLLTIADGLSNNGIRDIYQDRAGDVWVATDFSVTRIHRDGRIESFARRPGIGTGYALSIAQSGDGRLWFATGVGLAEFDGAKFTLHAAPKELPSNRLFGVEADADDPGTVWVITDGDGLIRFRGGKSKVITTRQGLGTDKIVSVADDRQGRLWFGTGRGVFSASKRELNAIADGTATHIVSRFYDENDGLGSRQCNGASTPAALRSRDGRIWFATAKGVSMLAGGRAIPLPPRVPIIERVFINNKLAAMNELHSIPPGSDRIEFDWSGVTFVTPERMRFRYRLEGYDENWMDGGTKRAASYTNLPAGEYRFLLESSRDGVRWSGTAVPFAMKPHFYETRWFLALLVLAVFALLLILHNMRLHFSRERARHLEQLVEERTRQISEEKERTVEALRQAEAARIEADAARREAERHEKLVEDALQRAESASQAKSIFLANTSHELRTPLNAIIGFSELLIENAAHRIEPRHVRFLQNILSSGEYLLGHINNILDLSKIEAGRSELQPETVILYHVANEISAVMKGVATLREIVIEVEIPEDLPAIEADPTHIKQILYNLISNAVKFSRDKSVVRVTARHLPSEGGPLGAIEIRVIDHGIGIDPKDHELIFQEFRQAHGAKGERPQGTGLGLALVKRFVEMHHGTIRVESRPGEGSTFIVILPRKYQRPSPAEQSARRDAVGKM
ncbi:MAG TPA: two-component regulator propeller domain-containing protein [Thermoanaerobaculia bacterium]|nr:two-component regulator propeller domain-containing protein [Thermoanaerobaculia bacterium]